MTQRMNRTVGSFCRAPSSSPSPKLKMYWFSKTTKSIHKQSFAALKLPGPSNSSPRAFSCHCTNARVISTVYLKAVEAVQVPSLPGPPLQAPQASTSILQCREEKRASTWPQVPARPTTLSSCSPYYGFPVPLKGSLTWKARPTVHGSQTLHTRKIPESLRITHCRLAFRIIILKWDYIFLFSCWLQIPKPTGIHLKPICCVFMEENNQEISAPLNSWEFCCWRVWFGLYVSSCWPC